MRNCLIALMLSSTVLCAQQAATPNPCNEAPSQLQMDRCADYKFKLADARLKRVYEKLMQLMISHEDAPESEYHKKTIQALKGSEATWLSYRDIQCKAAGQLYEGGSMAPMIYSQCLETITTQRVEALKSIYEEGEWKLE